VIPLLRFSSIGECFALRGQAFDSHLRPTGDRVCERANYSLNRRHRAPSNRTRGGELSTELSAHGIDCWAIKRYSSNN
jgi:hypothetical protein